MYSSLQKAAVYVGCRQVRRLTTFVCVNAFCRCFYSKRHTLHIHMDKHSLSVNRTHDFGVTNAMLLREQGFGTEPKNLIHQTGISSIVYLFCFVIEHDPILTMHFWSHGFAGLFAGLSDERLIPQCTCSHYCSAVM